MKGYYQKRPDNKMADRPPCGFCLHEKEPTAGAYCYNCVATIDLVMHKPNAETEFACFVAKDEEALAALKRLQEGEVV